MGKIIIATFVTMDGVIQAPGGPEEDSTGGFKWGGWSANFWDDMMNQYMANLMNEPFDLLLGRRTYEIFAAHWAFTNDEMGEKFTAVIKYVVSHSPQKLEWKNSQLVTGNVPAELKKVKQGGKKLVVFGSGNLTQTLLTHGLIDEAYIWTFPVTVGKGKRLFGEGTVPATWKVSDAKTSGTGVIIAKYEPAGELKPGSFALENPTKQELERREKWKKEDLG